MIKKLLNLGIFYFPLLLQAQVTVSVQLPAGGMIQKDQLWNIVLTNSGTKTVEATILLNLQDAITGQSVLSAGTRSVLLSKGVKMLSVRDVQPVQYNYGMSGLSGNFLPLGAYIACYTLTSKTGEKFDAIADECVRLNITPLSPPLLNTPADKSVLLTTIPQFTWLPPSPMDMFDNLNYELSVAEVFPGQSSTDAILNNIPVYVKAHVQAPFENYPSGYSKLQPGKTYAWQVIAKNGQNYSAATEVWTFNIGKDSAQVNTVNSNYIFLKNKGESGTSYITEHSLNIKYYSFDKEHEAMVRFFNVDGKLIHEKKQKIIYGDNFLGFKLNNSFRQGEVYQIEIRDLQNNIKTASFSIK